MAKVFKKSKKLYFGAILVLFAKIWTTMNFPEKKKALSVFKYSNYLPLCQKSEKTNEAFLRKIPNCWTDRQTDNSDFLGPSVGQGSNH